MRRIGSAAVEAGSLGGCWAIFGALQDLLGQDHARATADALTIARAERLLHLDVEASMNSWLVDHETLSSVAAVAYAGLLLAPPLVLVLTFVLGGAAYPQLRRSLVALTALSLLPFWVFPEAPPRFAQPGIVDVVATHALLGQTPDGPAGPGDSFAAMPSLHVAWTTWCAFALWQLARSRHRRAAWLAWLLPAAAVLDVLATGNHYLLDAVAGLGLVAVAVLAAARVDGILAVCRSRRNSPSSSPETVGWRPCG
jgi:membrane-associated phospholipid phosphatase